MVATTRHIAVDAAEDVIVEYDPKPAVVDPEAALEDGAPLVWDQFGTNKTHEWAVGGGDIDAALAEADVIVEHRFVNHRTSGAPIEPRCSIAAPRRQAHALLDDPDPAHRALRLLRDARHPEDQLRVIAPDGRWLRREAPDLRRGGAGAGARQAPRRPVKWVETRSEHSTTTSYGRDQINYVKLGASVSDAVTACQVRIIADLGAYQQLLTPFIPSSASR